MISPGGNEELASIDIQPKILWAVCSRSRSALKRVCSAIKILSSASYKNAQVRKPRHPVPQASALLYRYAESSEGYLFPLRALCRTKRQPKSPKQTVRLSKDHYRSRNGSSAGVDDYLLAGRRFDKLRAGFSKKRTFRDFFCCTAKGHP